MKVLVLFAHPAQQHSRVNLAMADVARADRDVTFVDLYGEYPRFGIDIEKEQQRLLDHDAIVFQFPILWYSTPAILKEWQDLVLEHGFAYGEGGDALKGKLWVTAASAGGPEAAYSETGRNRVPIREMLAPLEATARLCQMPFVAPYVLFGALRTGPDQRGPHVEGYRRLLAALRHDHLDLHAALAAQHLTAQTIDDVLGKVRA